ncbi:transcriptional regulator, GntR family with UTRA sensor domain [Mycolicibacterium rhodesiae JS60]|nr:transcriptional regulator, GntR family with UTRA sensor domain [Mycolicibacterium rhodesiae JS60]
MRPRPTGPVRPETVYQRNRRTPDRLNNSLRRTYDLLRSTLQNGQGDQFLVEGELIDALSASRNTVRAVLQQLAKDGLVTRSPKRGTRSAGALMLRINHISPVREFGGDSSIRTELKTLEYRPLGSLRVVRDRLRLPPDWTVLMIESLLAQDKQPLGIAVSYIALHPDDSHNLEVDEPDPILFLERRLDVKITGSRTTIGATAADEQSAALVGVELGAPMIFLEDILEDACGQPRALSQFRMRSDRIAFTACASRSA